MNSLVPAVGVVVKIGEDREVAAMSIEGLQGGAALEIEPRFLWEKAARPEAEVIANANETPGIACRGCGGDPRGETLEDRQGERDTHPTQEAAAVNVGLVVHGSACFVSRE